MFINYFTGFIYFRTATKDMIETTDKQISITELLAKRSYNPDYIPNKENIVFTISGKHVGSLQNFCVYSGLP